MLLMSGTPGLPDIVEGLLPNVPNFIAHILATIIILILLNKLVYKHYRQVVEKRKIKINELLDDAVQKQANANKERQEAAVILTDAKRESQDIINVARITADDEKLNIINVARNEAGNIQANARKSIEREKIAAEETIRRNVIDIAFAAANKVVSEKISPQENEKLINEFLKELDK